MTHDRPVLPSVLQDAIDNFDLWNRNNLSQEQQRNKIETPLYHYTDGRGLKGIMESQTIWFTDYRHLNDPSELVHGLEVAHDVIRLLETGADKRVRYFLDYLRRIFIEEKCFNFL